MTNIKYHPCFSEKAHFKYGRIHLPVAPLCNLGCNYCFRVMDRSFCKEMDHPGVTSRIITPKQSLSIVKNELKKKKLSVVGIAGPGEPLANKETFETMRIMKKEFPSLMRCLSTNGLLLPQSLPILKEIQLSTLTVTLNAIDPEIGIQIYSFIVYNHKKYEGKDAFFILRENQLKGIKEAIKLGIDVKVNSILIPEVNGEHLVEIAKLCADMGVKIMNITPLIPLYKFKDRRKPTCEEMTSIREKCGKFIEQFHLCKQCRADAVGVPGLENNGINEEYFHS